MGFRGWRVAGPASAWGLALALAATPTFAQPATIGSWKVDSPAAGTQRAAMAEPTSTFRLEVVCAAKKLSVDLAPANPEFRMPDVDHYDLQIRFDREAAIAATGAGADNGSVVIAGAGALLAGLIKAETIGITLKSPDGGQIRLTFLPQETATALKDIAASCR